MAVQSHQSQWVGQMLSKLEIRWFERVRRIHVLSIPATIDRSRLLTIVRSFRELEEFRFYRPDFAIADIDSLRRDMTQVRFIDGA